MGYPDLVSALVVANLGHGDPDGMVWRVEDQGFSVDSW